MRRPILCCTVVLLSSAASALTAQVGSMRLTVPSPTAASLGKFGDIPVSLYTGIPDITIPLFVAKGRTLELPIALKYHAGGIRVEERGGWAGIGWALEAGGTITRTVRGVVDELAAGYFYTGHTFYDNSAWPIPTQTVLDNIKNEWVDSEPDQFFFSFAGRSGEIVMGPTSTSPSLKEYHAIPHHRWRIEPNIFQGNLSDWVITTEDGTRYEFVAVETNTDYSLPSSGQIPTHYGASYPSAWHLTAIQAPGGDRIELGYESYAVRHVVNMYWEKFDFVQYSGEQPCRADQYGTVNDHVVAGARLASITTAAHTITFHAGLREDALSATGGQQEPRLDSIRVTTPSGTVLRVFKLEHDYSTGRLTLRNVYERDANGVALPPHTLTYGGPLLPPVTSYAFDHWGFYNGQTTNVTPVPKALYAGVVPPGADRYPDSAYARAGILTKITYPTGGYSEFVYQSNDYGGVGMSAEIPIAEGPAQSLAVNSWENGGTANFTVGGTHTAIATVRVEQDPGDCAGQFNPPCPINEIVGVAGWQESYGLHDIALEPGTYTLRASDAGTYPNGWARIEITWRDRGPMPKATGGGLRVAEVRTADAMGAVTIRKYLYTLQSDPARSSGVVSAEPFYAYSFFSPDCAFFSRSSVSRLPLGTGEPVGYREVTVLHGSAGEFGKTRHTFRSVTDASDPGQEGAWPSLRRTDLEWQRGQETGLTEFNAAGQIQARSATTYGFPPRGRFQGLSVYFFADGGSIGGEPLGFWIHNPFEIFSNWVQQEVDTSVVYSESGADSVKSAKAYAYGNALHGQVTQLTETNSNGTQRITRMTYPADFAQGTGSAEAAALTAMQTTAHIHNAVVERWVIERTGGVEKVVQATLTTFKQYGSGQYLPYQLFTLNSPTGVP